MSKNLKSNATRIKRKRKGDHHHFTFTRKDHQTSRRRVRFLQRRVFHHQLPAPLHLSRWLDDCSQALQPFVHGEKRPVAVIFLRLTWRKQGGQRGRLKYRKKVFTRSRNYSWVVIRVSLFFALFEREEKAPPRTIFGPPLPPPVVNLPLTDLTVQEIPG